MRKLIMLLFALMATFMSNAQVNFRISGTVTDENNNSLTGASIVIIPGNYGTTSDYNGKYLITGLKPGTYILNVSFLGYDDFKDTIILAENLWLGVKLESAALSLNEVEIIDNYNEAIKKANPMNIEIVSDDFLHHNTGGSLMQSLSRLPGISSIDIGSGQSKPLIRGLGFNRVLVTENGITHESQQWGSDHGLEIDQFAASSIEIIKGPASIMYGSDAIGGVINIKDSDIPEINSLNIKTDFIAKSNNDHLGTSVVVDGRKNNLFAGIRLTASDYGDYKVPTDSIDIYSYRAALLENRLRNTAGNEINFHFNTGYVGEKMQLRLFVSNSNSKSGFFANAHGLEPRSVDTLLHDASSRDINYPYQLVNHFKSSASIKWKLNRLSIESDIGYQRNFRQEFSQYVSHGYMPAVFSVGNDFTSDTEREFDKSVYSGNLKFTFLQSETTSFIAGVNSVYQNNKINGRSFIIPAYRQTTVGTYLLVSHSFSKASRFQAGIRYDYGHITTDEYQDWFASPVIIDNDTTYEYLQRSQPLSLSFGNTTWSIGYNYNPGKWNYKFNVGKSFRIPIPKELAANGVNYHHFSYEKGNASLSAEISYQADAGILYGTKNFAAEITPFVNYFPNYIYLNPTSEHDRLYGNGNQVFYYTQSEVFRYGGELHAHYKLTSYLQAGIIGEYVYSVQLSGEKEGFGLPFSPPAQMLINLKFMPKDFGIIQKPTIAVDYVLTSAQNRIVPPEEPTDGYSIINLSFGADIRMKNQIVSFSIQIKNLFNTKYFSHTGYYRLINVPEPGRNFVLNISVPIGVKID